MLPSQIRREDPVEIEAIMRMRRYERAYQAIYDYEHRNDEARDDGAPAWAQDMVAPVIALLREQELALKEVED